MGRYFFLERAPSNSINCQFAAILKSSNKLLRRPWRRIKQSTSQAARGNV
jgi:hypothetical protein